MYQILFDGNVVYDPRLIGNGYGIRDASLHLTVGLAGTLTFTIDDTHPMASLLTRMHGIMEVRDDDVPIFRGRIVRDTKGFLNSRVIECEELLAVLSDSIVEPYAFPQDFVDDPDYATACTSGNVVAYWLGKLLASHNAQVSQSQQITLGNVTVTDSNNYIIRENEDYSSTWETINEKLQQSTLGGYLMLRYTSGSTYLDYLADFPLTNVQQVEFSRNLLDVSDEVYGGELYTSILPVGAGGMTIEELPDGSLSGNLVKAGKTIYDSVATATYGKIVRVVKWDDVTVDTNLRAKAAALLAQEGITMPDTITCMACDLSSIEGTSSFRVGRYIRIVSVPHNMSALYPLMDLTIDILNPANTQIVMGGSTRTISGVLSEQQSELMDEAEAMMDEKISKSMQTVREITETMATSMEQTASEIVINALSRYTSSDDLEAIISELRSQLNATANEWSLSFTRVSREINRVESEWQEQYRNITTWYTFGEDGLEIGKSSSRIKMRLANDRISFLDNGYEVAYISDNELYITDARFLNMLRIGRFGFIPRSNGNLSFAKVE